mmetsp:Transcript_25611/g.33522  ORF Transcript_25611/g.33522 Transcript_25611/m.33522 type:complete len:327 (+) Transcript_25611:48-1028(+)
MHNSSLSISISQLLQSFCQGTLYPAKTIFASIKKQTFNPKSFIEFNKSLVQIQHDVTQAWKRVKDVMKYSLDVKDAQAVISAADKEVAQFVAKVQEFRDRHCLQWVSSWQKHEAGTQQSLSTSAGQNSMLDQATSQHLAQIKQIRVKHGNRLSAPPPPPDERIRFKLDNYVLDQNYQFQKIDNSRSELHTDEPPLVDAQTYQKEVLTQRFIIPQLLDHQKVDSQKHHIGDFRSLNTDLKQDSDQQTFESLSLHQQAYIKRTLLEGLSERERHNRRVSVRTGISKKKSMGNTHGSRNSSIKKENLPPSGSQFLSLNMNHFCFSANNF